MISDFGNEFMPRRATDGSAGYDFYYPHDTRTFVPGEIYEIDTGIHIEDGDMKSRYYLGCMPRSSMRKKYGLDFMGEMVIDADYRDSIKVYFIVHRIMTLNKGDRFMQGIVRGFETFPNEIQPTMKRTGGTGSTGI
jgi:deoxyuridine 5'-triphosphate nucleotidohydrolase